MKLAGEILRDVLLVSGMVCICYAAWLSGPVAGMTAVGVCLLLSGLGLAVRQNPPLPPPKKARQ